MPKVFIPQVPSRLDRGARIWVPTVDLGPAERFGDIVVMLPPEANRMHIGPIVAAMKERMENFTEEDYLVAVGDPSLIAAASVIATRRCNGFLRLLKWDRITSNYNAVEMKL